MNCKVIVNTDSGNCNKLNLDKLLKSLGCVDVAVEHIDSHADWSADNCDTVIVCGGDGTLHNALEKCADKTIVYVPCGTLNEAAHTDDKITSIGRVNDEPFSYVCAAGSFTEIGYTAKNNHKKHFKSLAYLPQIFSSYHCRKIQANINVDGRVLDGEYTLIMVLKSHRCFGFNFNKSYAENKGLYLLAIRSFGEDSFLNKVKMFAPFFRVFICGVKHPASAKNWLLTPFDNLTVTLKEPQNFCLDGEKRILKDELRFCEQTLDKQIKVVRF